MIDLKDVLETIHDLKEEQRRELIATFLVLQFLSMDDDFAIKPETTIH